MKLRPDKPLRSRWFAPEAMQHPAKGHLGLWWELFERYTQPGQWVLDPMAGIGSSLIGALMGRNVVCVELESHFLRTMTGYPCDGTSPGYDLIEEPEQLEGWYVRAEFGTDVRRFDTQAEAQAFYQQRMAERADVRGQPDFRPYKAASTKRVAKPAMCGEKSGHQPHHVQGSWAKMRQQAMLGHELGEVLILQGDARCLPLGRAETVITSPPWEEQNIRAVGDEPYGGQRWGGMQRQIKNTNPYTRPSAVVTSPPYETSVAADNPNVNDYSHGGFSASNQRGAPYTRPVASVITSPPWNDEREGGGIRQPGHPDGEAKGLTHWEYGKGDNIGNLRGERYWEAMRQVYGECHRVLAPGGLMVLVVKGYTRDKEYVDLPQQTVDCCQELGFTFVERWERELWNLSFWRILQQRRDPAAFDERLRYESVLVLRSG